MQNKKLKIILVLVVVVLLIVAISIITPKADAPTTNDNLSEQNDENLNTGILGNEDDLVFLSIVPKSKISGTLNLTGEVQGGYFFEGNILVNILDLNKNLLKQGYGTATTDWMTAGPVSFKATIDLTGFPAGQAYLEIHNDNPSGLPENDKNILIPITIN